MEVKKRKRNKVSPPYERMLLSDLIRIPLHMAINIIQFNLQYGVCRFLSVYMHIHIFCMYA